MATPFSDNARGSADRISPRHVFETRIRIRLQRDSQRLTLQGWSRNLSESVRSTCKRGTPVLALYKTSPSEAGNADVALAVQEGTDALVTTVARMLASRKKVSLKRKARAGH